MADSLDSGHAAMARGEWANAADHFRAGVGSEDGDRLRQAHCWDGLGQCHFWLGQAAPAVEAHQRAFELYRTTGAKRDAARMAFWLFDDHLSLLASPAPANGWLERAERLLEGDGASEEWAWLPVYQGHYRLQILHDIPGALALADEARRRGAEVDAQAVQTVALSLEGLALVVEGRVPEGMARLDEASAVSAVGHPDDLNSIAWSFCYVIQGCDTVRDFARASEWCRRVVAFCERWDLAPIFTTCRTRYASVLTWQGDWAQADEQIQRLLEGAGPAGVGISATVVRGAALRRGELSRRRGQLDAAEAHFRQAGEHWSAVLGRGMIALARGQRELARDLADRVLRLLPREDRAERADAVLLAVEARSGLGDAEGASRGLAELEASAAQVGTAVLRAHAARARAVVAASRNALEEALAAFEDALQGYDDAGAPHEAALMRLEVARVLADLGRTDTALHEATAAAEVLEALGAAGDAVRARQMLESAEPSTAQTGGRIPGLPLTPREVEVLRLAGRGMSNQQIGEALFISPHTVKRHVANILRKLDAPSRAAAVAKASRTGAL